MKIKEVHIELLPNDTDVNCSAWVKDEGFHEETNTVSCDTRARYRTTYEHFDGEGLKSKTHRDWCKNCLPAKFDGPAKELEEKS